MEVSDTVPEPVSLLASGQTHEYNPFYAHKSPRLLSEEERSLRGVDKESMTGVMKEDIPH